MDCLISPVSFSSSHRTRMNVLTNVQSLSSCHRHLHSPPPHMVHEPPCSLFPPTPTPIPLFLLGVVSSSSFRTKLLRFRSKAEAQGIDVLGLPPPPPPTKQQEQQQQSSQWRNGDIDYNDAGGSGGGGGGKAKQTPTKGNQRKVESSSSKTTTNTPSSASSSSSSFVVGAEEARLQQLEAMMYSMAQREMELALALAESQAEAKSLDGEIGRLRGVHPQFRVSSLLQKNG